MENSLGSRLETQSRDRRKKSHENHTEFNVSADKLIINYCLINHEMRILLASLHYAYPTLCVCFFFGVYFFALFLFESIAVAYPQRHKISCNLNYSTALYSMATNDGKIYCSLVVTLYRCNPVRKEKR